MEKSCGRAFNSSKFSSEVCVSPVMHARGPLGRAIGEIDMIDWRHRPRLTEPVPELASAADQAVVFGLFLAWVVAIPAALAGPLPLTTVEDVGSTPAGRTLEPGAGTTEMRLGPQQADPPVVNMDTIVVGPQQDFGTVVERDTARHAGLEVTGLAKLLGAHAVERPKAWSLSGPARSVAAHQPGIPG